MSSLITPFLNNNSVEVEAPARIHLGLLQFSDFYSTIFMGIGFAISYPCWRMQISSATSNEIIMMEENVSSYSSKLIEEGHLLLNKLSIILNTLKYKVIVNDGIPSHIGLGAKTSFLCSIIAGVSCLHGLSTWEDLIKHTGRGGTSGIGINICQFGGFILDSGHNNKDKTQIIGPSSSRIGAYPPGVVSRLVMNDHNIILAAITNVPRIHNEVEQNIFNSEYPIEKQEIDIVAGLVLFEILPAVVTGDMKWFAQSLQAFQNIGFKKREWNYQNDRVKSLRDSALKAGASCVALSSMGPSVAIFGDSLDDIEKRLISENISGLVLKRVQSRNQGITTRNVNVTEKMK